MPDPDSIAALPVHPHQLEVQEFDSYGLIVDLRSASDFATDHIPGAVSVPWSPEASSSVAAKEAVQPPLFVAEPCVPYGLESRVRSLERDEAVLLYCDRGGVHSQALAELLGRPGLAIDVLPGGWDNYRRWVAAGLEILGRSLSIRWVRGLPSGGSQALVAALARCGEQVLDLASLLGQPPLTTLSMADTCALSAQAMETRLVDALRRFDPNRVVWADEVLLFPWGVALPVAFDEALRRSDVVRVEMGVDARVGLLRRRLAEEGVDASALVEALRRGVPGTLAKPLDAASEQLALGKVGEALTVALRDWCDPLHHQFSAAQGHARIVQVVSPDDFDAVAAALSGGDSGVVAR